MLIALHLVFGQSHDWGIRSIGWFLELSKLDAFIASSFGSQQKVASQVEQLIGQFGHQEDQRLGQQMLNATSPCAKIRHSTLKSAW